MSEPKKIISQTLKQFPGGTWNALVEGELRDRIPKKQFQQATPFAPPSTVLVQLIWMGSTSVPPGSVVVLTDPPREFADDPSVPFGGLQFKCIAPTTATLDSPFAITATPLDVITGKKAMGWGYIPNSCWAQVTINAEADETAELLDADTLLSSTETGRVPIIWKPTGTGVKWCVVLLSASGGSVASVAGSVGMVFDDIPLADSWASMSGSPSLSWTVALGEAGPPALDDDSEWTETSGVLLFDWERLAGTKNEYIGTDGTLAPYDTDFDTMTPVVELAAGARRWAWRRGVNRSKTDIRASESEPVLVAGYEQTIRQDGGLYRLFIITDVMDFRSLPGFVVGDAPSGADDPDLQIPYHSGGNTDFELNSEDCAGA